MKKLLYIPVMALALLATACAGEEDDLFDASAAERLNAASGKYSALLESSPGGWVIQYYPTNDGAYTTGVGYLWCVKFNKDKSVLVGMNNYFTGNLYREETSGWDVITDNGPVLTFNTMNTLVHSFSDPDVRYIPESDENVWGVGVGGDYEFVIVDAPEDHSYVMLKGKKRATYNLMTPVPEGVSFEDYLADVDSFAVTTFPPTAPNNRLMSFGDKRFVVTDISNGFITLYPEGGDEITETEDYPYTVYKNGSDYFFRLRGAYRPEGVSSENSILQLKYDAVADLFVDESNPDKWLGSELTPEVFFKEQFEGGRPFKVNRESPVGEMSEKMQLALNAASDGIKGVNKNYAINQVSVRYDEENGARWFFKYQTGNSARNVEYIYGCQLEGNTIGFTYQRADQSNGEAIKSRVTEISDLLEQTLSQQFTISKVYTVFNLGKLKFTAVNDPDLWFVVNY